MLHLNPVFFIFVIMVHNGDDTKTLKRVYQKFNQET